MTARVFPTLVMLAQVLACPFLDCGECRGACAAQSVELEDTRDECCRVPDTADESVCEHRSATCDDPVCPDNPGPLDCLCGGAVAAHALECPDLLASGEWLTLPDALPAPSPLLTGAASGTLAIEGCPHFPPLIPGTSICALTQTYLL